MRNTIIMRTCARVRVYLAACMYLYIYMHMVQGSFLGATHGAYVLAVV